MYMYIFFFGNPAVLSDPFNIGIRSWDPLELGFFAAHFALLLVVFLLTCFADHKPEQKQYSVKIDGDMSNGLALIQKPLIDDEKANSEGNDISFDVYLIIFAHIIIFTEKCPELKASFLSYITYWWFNQLAVTGFKKSLKLSDLWQLNPEYSTNIIAPRFDRAWISQIKHHCREDVLRYEKTTISNGGNGIGDGTLDGQLMTNFVDPNSKKNPRTLFALIRTFGWYFASGVVFKLINDLLMFVNPQVLK